MLLTNWRKKSEERENWKKVKDLLRQAPQPLEALNQMVSLNIFCINFLTKIFGFSNGRSLFLP